MNRCPLTSEFLTLVVGADGTITSLVDAATGREAVPPTTAMRPCASSAPWAPRPWRRS